MPVGISAHGGEHGLDHPAIHLDLEEQRLAVAEALHALVLQ